MLNLKFAKQAIEKNTLTEHFQPHKKDHIMQTRQQNTYKVTHANTNRLKNSSIIFMQQELNKENINNKNRKRKRS